MNLIRRTAPDEINSSPRRILEDISARCDPCQRIQTAPKRFRVTLGAEHVVFNDRVLLDIMYIDSSPILHVVYDATRFSAARFFPDVSTSTIRTTFMECRALIYKSLPDRILVDQGSSFGDQFKAFGQLTDVSISSTGVEAHSSLGIGEPYHQPLRTTFRKIRLTFPRRRKEFILAISVASMNDTLGPEGLVPSSLVFGEMPPLKAAGKGVPPRPDLA